jgi:creatinine amidohydrolase
LYTIIFIKEIAMKYLVLHFVFCLISIAHLTAQQANSANFPIRFDELNSNQFEQAIEKSASTCIIPLGILEKHGPHLPLSADLITAREIALRAAEKEYTLVFPPYYFGQIFEAQHQPGTIAYSNELIYKLLDETCRELSRNGIKKIILVNGHGGNNNFLNYFCQTQLACQRDYIVVLFKPEADSLVEKRVNALRITTMDMHAGETETSVVYAIRPDLVHNELAANESGADLNRLSDIPYGYTAIWWYAKFPDHYAGEGTNASKEIGELLINSDVNQLVQLIRYLKTDNKILNLQEEYFDRIFNKD